MEKLQTHQAISLYKNKLKTKDFYPLDIEAILKENLNLGTWVSYFQEDQECMILHNNDTTQEQEQDQDQDQEIIAKTPTSWVIFSIWNSCEAYTRKKSHNNHPFNKCFNQARLRDKICPCLNLSLQKQPFGFFFLYGLYGEGARLEELMKSIWSFASNMGGNVKECKMIISELSVSDPLMQFVPHDCPFMSLIDDVWYLKKVNESREDDDRHFFMGQVGNVFVDP
ncbi:Acyl-CoA N-acyltransferases (NAT) superfamily protein [Euphorbia peplus]|nr:Acyl-CoA N-acyltransferases (NAT) superfamily protein [Euphorbia peplus]